MAFGLGGPSVRKMANHAEGGALNEWNKWQEKGIDVPDTGKQTALEPTSPRASALPEQLAGMRIGVSGLVAELYQNGHLV